MAIAGAVASAQSLDAGKSSIIFVSKQMNVPTDGKFTKFSAQIAFDPAKPEAGKAEITIDMASFDIGAKDMNDEAKDKSWFDVKNFPQAKFTASSFKVVSGGRYEVTGPLTIKGKTTTVTAPFTVKTDAGATVYEGVFPIKRLAYNVGDGAWKDTDTVADEVQIRFRLVMAGGGGVPAKK
jgi:polyisoprenoid-binding protein YceI